MGSFFGSFSVVLFFPIKVAKGLAHISGVGGGGIPGLWPSETDLCLWF